MDELFVDPADTREEILAAAFHALCDGGYADLTIKRIGEEFAKSPSLVYHHYDGKDELLLDLLEFTLNRFEQGVSAGTFDDPARERLSGYVAVTTAPDSVDDPCAPSARFMRTLIELRAQATHDPAYRAHFDRSDRVFREYLTATVREAAVDLSDADGANDTGGMDDADDATDARPHAGHVPPEEVAATLQTAAKGGAFRWATTDDHDWVPDVRRGLERYLDATLPLVDVEASGEVSGETPDGASDEGDLGENGE